MNASPQQGYASHVLISALIIMVAMLLHRWRTKRPVEPWHLWTLLSTLGVGLALLLIEKPWNTKWFYSVATFDNAMLTAGTMAWTAIIAHLIFSTKTKLAAAGTLLVADDARLVKTEARLVSLENSINCITRLVGSLPGIINGTSTRGADMITLAEDGKINTTQTPKFRNIVQLSDGLLALRDELHEELKKSGRHIKPSREI
jgi:hypothetical protein